MRIYLDLCTIQRPADDASQLRVYLEAQAVHGIVALIEAGTLRLVSSSALLIEHARNPHVLRRDVTERVLSLATEFVPIESAVEIRATQYQKLGLKPMDAAHLACAVEAGVDFFCTCDDRLLRRARALDTGLTRPITPLELIQEVER
jgi:predicted nucleic acid-binding protein